jgi:hypothetical protein
VFILIGKIETLVLLFERERERRWVIKMMAWA